MSKQIGPLLIQRFYDGTGKPLVGGKLYSYAAGTTTPKTTYSNNSGTTNTNPIILDSTGSCYIYLDVDPYKFALTDANDVPIWTVDNIYGQPVVSAAMAPVIAATTTDDALADLGGTTAAAALAAAAVYDLPTGAVLCWTTTAPPTNYLECNGAAVSRNTYSTLFSAIGTTFGVGNGTTTFNLPDTRGYFIRGWANGGSIDSGRTFASTQLDAFKAHSHTVTITDPGHKHAMGVGYSDKGGSGNGYCYSDNLGGSTVLGTADMGTNDMSSATTGITASATSTSTPAGDTETRPINLALMYIIKYS